jgi:hypothetical protein
MRPALWKKEAARPIIPLGKPNNPGGISVGPPCLATRGNWITKAAVASFNSQKPAIAVENLLVARRLLVQKKCYGSVVVRVIFPALAPQSSVSPSTYSNCV